MDSRLVGGTGERKRTFAERIVDSGVVTFLISSEKREFIIHKNLLLEKIPHFEKSCSSQGGFSESNTGVIELLHVSVNMFGILSDWIYGAGLPDIPNPEADPSTNIGQPSLQANSSAQTAQAQTITKINEYEKLYFEIMSYAEMWQSEQLKLACFNSILRYFLRSGRPMSVDLAVEGMKGVPSGSPFYMWILQVMAAQFVRSGPEKSAAILELLRKDNDDALRLYREIIVAMVTWTKSNKICDVSNQKIYGTKNIFASSNNDDVEVVPALIVLPSNAGGQSSRKDSHSRGGQAGRGAR